MEETMTPFVHALAYLEGGFGYYIGYTTYSMCVLHVIEQTMCEFSEAEKAVAIAIKALGKAPYQFNPPHYPNFTVNDIAVGDIVYGGRIVYNEYAMMHGPVIGIDRFSTFDGPMVLVEIMTQVEDYAPSLDIINIKSIYKVEKPHIGVDRAGTGGDYTPCHYCGMPANSVGFFDEPVCKGCGG